MDKKLLRAAVARYLFGLFMVFILLFIPAGTFKFYNGWLFIFILFIPMLISGMVLYLKNPRLLKRRLNSKENKPGQKRLVYISLVMFISSFIAAGLNFRFKWLILPKWLVFSVAAVFFISYLMYAEVIRENEYLSRTVSVEENQKVIDYGLYKFVRHPMYLASIFMFLSMPIMLGSLYSFFILLIYPAIVVVRIKNEEEFLEKNLKGYTEYKKRVKYRLIPFVW